MLLLCVTEPVHIIYAIKKKGGKKERNVSPGQWGSREGEQSCLGMVQGNLAKCEYTLILLSYLQSDKQAGFTLSLLDDQQSCMKSQMFKLV